MSLVLMVTGSPLEKHHPTIVSCSPLRKDYHDVLVPPIDMGGLVDASQDDVQDLCQEFSEWIALVSLGSPRVVAGDSVDPYLSRYSVPQVEISKPSDLVSLKWRGLIPSHWISQLFTLLLWVFPYSPVDTQIDIPEILGIYLNSIVLSSFGSSDADFLYPRLGFMVFLDVKWAVLLHQHFGLLYPLILWEEKPLKAKMAIQ